MLGFPLVNEQDLGPGTGGVITVVGIDGIEPFQLELDMLSDCLLELETSSV